ncbi:hypothetical protein [Bacteroides fluxus]|uniref:Conserved domain protein n=1 Tax=Bacteroides fluxus YIT 12057 TaxID=763034 RepID=F3PXM9_9BACE|nr:hypothetical protein [Bacteroides fluxus]EGF51611.1 conserved domain protein [Bacteroides fluxus YIT 12057]
MDFVFLLLGIICLHKNKQAWSFTIFIGLLTSYYQMGSNLSDFIVPHNVSDTGLLLMLYMLFYGYSRKVIYSYPVLKQLFWSIFCFSVFLTIAVLYDYAGGMDAISIIQSTRHWLLLLLAVPLLRYYPVGAFEKTIRYMLYVSLFATVLILLDHYAGTRLLDHGGGIFISNRGLIFQRGAIPTTYCVFYILLLLTGYFKDIRKSWSYLFVGILLLSILTSMIRSMLFSVVLGIVIVLHASGKLRLSSLGQVLIGLFLFGGVVLSDSGLKERILNGINEVNTLSLSSSSVKKEKGNMTFRLDLLEERFNYVSKRWDRSLFGIGSVKENDFPTTFKIGLYNGYRTTQLDTGDIAWALFILRLGILGTCLFLIFWGKMTLLFQRCPSALGLGGWVYLVVSFLIAFCGTTVSQGGFWFFMVMLLCVCYHSDGEETCDKEKDENLY